MEANFQLTKKQLFFREMVRGLNQKKIAPLGRRSKGAENFQLN